MDDTVEATKPGPSVGVVQGSDGTSPALAAPVVTPSIAPSTAIGNVAAISPKSMTQSPEDPTPPVDAAASDPTSAAPPAQQPDTEGTSIVPPSDVVVDDDCISGGAQAAPATAPDVDPVPQQTDAAKDAVGAASTPAPSVADNELPAAEDDAVKAGAAAPAAPPAAQAAPAAAGDAAEASSAPQDVPEPAAGAAAAEEAPAAVGAAPAAGTTEEALPEVAAAAAGAGGAAAATEAAAAEPAQSAEPVEAAEPAAEEAAQEAPAATVAVADDTTTAAAPEAAPAAEAAPAPAREDTPASAPAPAAKAPAEEAPPAVVEVAAPAVVEAAPPAAVKPQARAAPSPVAAAAGTSGGSKERSWALLDAAALAQVLARLAAADRRTSRRVCQAWNSVFLAALEALAPPQWPPSLQGGLLARCGALAALDLSRCFFDPQGAGRMQAWLQQLAHLPRLARLTLSKESLVVLRSLQHRARPQSLYVMALPAAIGQLTGLEHLAIVPCDTARPLQGHVQVVLPEELANLSRLTSLAMHDAASPLSALAPAALAALRSLTLAGPASLGGTTPALLAAATSLTELQLVSRSFSGGGPQGPTVGGHTGPQLRQLLQAALKAVLTLAAPHLASLSLVALAECPPKLLSDILAAHKGLTALTVSGCGMQAVPPSVFALPSLARLDLTNNQLQQLPDIGVALKAAAAPGGEAGAAPPLQHLDLGGNSNLQALAGDLGCLAQLTALRLCGTSVRSLPPSTAQLRDLKVLDLSASGVAASPDSLPSDLASVEELDLSSCRLAALPSALQGWAGLTRLALADNQLPALPEWLAGLSGLRALELGNNKLPEVPQVLEGLKGLRQLSLAGQIVEPDALGLAGNMLPLGPWKGLLYSQAADLPAWLLQLPALERLTLDSEPHSTSQVLAALAGRGVELPLAG